MMHNRCTSYSPNSIGPCTCGGAFHSNAPAASFPRIFENNSPLYPFPPPASSVDCTLSLGTPSTRLSDCAQNTDSSVGYWEFLQTKGQAGTPRPIQKVSSRVGSNNRPGSATDSLLARRCANCDTTSTPLWRNGPRGPKSLCNACGIRYKKEERRASVANASTKVAVAAVPMDHHYSYQSSSWVSSQKVPCYSPVASEFRFVDDNDSDAANISFLPWRLNVTDSPHDFTR